MRKGMRKFKELAAAAAAATLLAGALFGCGGGAGAAQTTAAQNGAESATVASTEAAGAAAAETAAMQDDAGSAGAEGAEAAENAATDAGDASAETTAAPAPAPAQAELPDLEVWHTNVGYLEVKQGGPTYQFYKDLTGVGVWQPYVEWNGGTTYQEQLNLRISAGEAPDIFLTMNAMEAELIKNGALMDLTDLLPEKAPHIWNLVPQEVWDVVRSYDPSGEGRIYMVPQIRNYALTGGMIRQDWLDKLGLEVPATQEEFHAVLAAFKEQDPNGNGQSDEIPIVGRQSVNSLEQIFSMYGVPVIGTSPQWDVFGGELTYAAVTPNMKEALQYISGLYAEGLIDPESLLNDLAAWKGKLASDRAGLYFHWVQASYEYAEDTFNATGAKPDWAVIAPIGAPGYQPFYAYTQMTGSFFVAPKTNDAMKAESVMKFFDAYGNQALWSDFQMGVEGMHCDVVDGKKVQRPVDYTTQENRVMRPYEDIVTVDETVKFLESINSADRAWAIDRSIDNLIKNQAYGKAVGGDGMPASVYDGYPDILNRTLYVEYASKIITGEWPIDKFDEFVERWHASGGADVTGAAREWYARVGK
jgi:putative aldouronate transport system substrate-binding protein